MKNVTDLKKENCSGCALCMNICPLGIISMDEDEEGFMYPNIADSGRCISCGKCLAKCPVINKENTKPIDYSGARYVYKNDDDYLKKSSSGGVAAGLYEHFLSSGDSYAIGVRYTEDSKNVEFCCTSEITELDAFRGSKYVKADPSHLIKTIAPKLEAGSNVVFVGLPCEVGALRNYFGNESHLYLIEMICHGPSSHLLLESYISSIESKTGSQVERISMRGKRPYWKPYYMISNLKDGTEFSEKFIESSFSDGFQIYKRPSCNNCKFKDGSSNADLIIGDFHAAQKGLEEYNCYGVSIAFPVTEKGKTLIDILEKEGFKVGKTTMRKAKGNYALLRAIKRFSVRKRFINKLRTEGLDNASNDSLVRLNLKMRVYMMKGDNLMKEIRSRFMKKSKMVEEDYEEN